MVLQQPQPGEQHAQRPPLQLVEHGEGRQQRHAQPLRRGVDHPPDVVDRDDPLERRSPPRRHGLTHVAPPRALLVQGQHRQALQVARRRDRVLAQEGRRGHHRVLLAEQADALHRRARMRTAVHRQVDLIAQQRLDQLVREEEIHLQLGMGLQQGPQLADEHVAAELHGRAQRHGLLDQGRLAGQALPGFVELAEDALADAVEILPLVGQAQPAAAPLHQAAAQARLQLAHGMAHGRRGEMQARRGRGVAAAARGLPQDLQLVQFKVNRIHALNENISFCSSQERC